MLFKTSNQIKMKMEFSFFKTKLLFKKQLFREIISNFTLVYQFL